MKTPFLSLALGLGLVTLTVTAQDRSRPQPPPPEGGNGAPRMHLLPRGAEEALNLTESQRKQLAELETESRAKVEAILTPEQKQKLTTLRPPGGGQPNDRRPAPPTGNAAPVAQAAPTAENKPLPAGVTRQPVVFNGGHETVPVDHGRPVALIAAALGVKDEVFREAFSHVHPAGPGRGGPTEAEAHSNKQALLGRLAQYGITNERLDTVSNFYRYAGWEGGIWKNQAAAANALVKDGAIIGYEVVNGGYGYTTPPTMSVPGFPNAAATVALSYGKAFETNGAVSTITLAQSR